jgi:hypothetical protein
MLYARKRELSGAPHRLATTDSVSELSILRHVSCAVTHLADEEVELGGTPAQEAAVAAAQ